MTGEDNHEQKPSILGKITEGYHEGKRDAEEDVRARAGKDNHEQKPSILDKITEGYHEGKHKAEEDEHARAAAKIQKVWREKKGRAQADYLSSELRWRDAAIRARAKIHRTSADAGKNSAKERWNRGVFFASKLREENEVLKKPGTEDTDPNALRVEKHLETQHWLELVDAKHRYGSNLKYYHRKWRESDTTDNFFKWLDHGEGAELSLDECSREQLEKERIIYLSAEQRLNYLVKFDDVGRLRWARNNDLVDTTAERWKDGNGAGIVPEDMPERPVQPRGSFESLLSEDESSVGSDAAMHYAGNPKGRSRLSKVFYQYFTIRGVTNKLLRKTVRRNTWIYVTDKHYNMFIGIKKTGTFQHSSFLAGAIVTSAGLISVKDGLIHTLSPLSGHYRTSINHFHQFVDVLTERGVDMSKVKISKAEAALWGIEHIKKWQKKQTHLKEEGKERAAKVGHAVADTFKMTSNSDWKREILEGRKRPVSKESHAADSTEGKPEALAEKDHTQNDNNGEHRPKELPNDEKVAPAGET